MLTAKNAEQDPALYAKKSKLAIKISPLVIWYTTLDELFLDLDGIFAILWYNYGVRISNAELFNVFYAD